MVFVFSFLTPLALVAAFGLVAFVGAVLAGTLESMYHRPGMPDWVSTLVVYLVLAVAAYVFRAMWGPHLPGLASLVARAMRSEEHTSELQSLAYIACRLLLEK